MDTIKAVVFDLDNTLVDRTTTFTNFARSFTDTYFQHIDFREGLVKRIIELDEDGYKEKNAMFKELLTELPWSSKPELTELLHYYEKKYVEHALLMDDAKDVLRYTSEKYKTGLITNGKTSVQYGKLDRLKLRSSFDVIVVSEEAGIKKPDSRIFEIAAEQLNLKPEECVYIGDHPVNDIEGAAAAGMKTIWLQVSQPWREGLTVTPMHSITSLKQLLDLL
ncbi:HAD family hydrolase [Paenibacillus medicaginis]|uniref:HAD family hydrolase n=1 Tax=Paenibacillus medicaginis TaxID=1470560 RepID=A0ABV5BYG3_9BACL